MAAAFARVLFAPSIHHLNHGYEGFAKRGERVFHFGRHLRIHLAVHDAIVFQFAQLQREHALGDVGQEAAQFIEALRACAQVVENQNFPFAAYDVQSRGDCGTLLGMLAGIVCVDGVHSVLTV